MRSLRNLFILAIAILGISSFSVSAQTNAFGSNNTQGLERQVRKEIMTQQYYGLFDAVFLQFGAFHLKAVPNAQSSGYKV